MRAARTRLRRPASTVLSAFDRWFCSTAGVYQTLLVTIAIVAVEQVWPQLDPQHFAVLYLLTIYSAITQPALAHTGHEASVALDAVQRQNQQQTALLVTLAQHIEALAVQDDQTLAESSAMLRQLHAALLAAPPPPPPPEMSAPAGPVASPSQEVAP